MLKNYLKSAFRNLSRNKSYTIINMLGLTIGIAACLLIFSVILFESSFDNFHSKKTSIYRIGTELHTQEGVHYSDAIAFPAGPALRVDFPQLKEVASIFKQGGQITIEKGNNQIQKITEDNFYYAEPSFFNMFDFGWLAGDPTTSLRNPNNVVLTQATAEKFFGDWKSALGKTIEFENKTLYTITGILKNVPPNTDFPLSVVVPYTALQNTYLNNFQNDWSTFGGAYTFVVLPPRLSPAKFNSDLEGFAKKHKPAQYAKDAPFAQPLTEIHYDERFGNYRDHTFSHSLIFALSLIGIFLLVIACVNFINLATAQAIKRSKEVGVRKVLGSNRHQLIFQFLIETAIITVIALIAAIVVAEASLPFFNKLLEIDMSMNFISNPALIVFLLIVAILTSLLSGIYPAFILSGFDPIKALNNKVTSKMAGGISLRRGLVVLQFTIAHVLIISMLIIVSQMGYFKNKSLGFERAAILNVPVPHDSISHSRIDYLHNSLLKNPDIKNVSFSWASPSAENNWNTDFKYNHAAKATNFGANLKWADADYFRTYDLQFVAGRSYYPSDTVREFVVNETLLARLGIRDPKNAIGKEINLWNGGKVANIVGVIRDFNSSSLRKPMAPVILSTWKDVYQTINIKIKPGTEKTTLPFVEKLWNGAFPDYVFLYQFLDETIANFYKQENQLSTLYKIFAGIAIFISCLGLYGLVSFMTSQRTKEIGIRKVMGASTGHIMYLFSRELTILIGIAFFVAAPLAYYFMQSWLEGFAFHIRLGIGLFLLAIAGSILIAWLTVGYKAFKAAIANPVLSLRSE